MARNFCGFALLFLCVIIQFMQAMSQSDDCPADAACGKHKSDYSWPKRDGYLIRHNGMVCVCHPRRLPQEKQTMFVVNKPTVQKQSITIKRSLAYSPASYESDCPADAPCGTQESDYTYSKRYGYLIRHNGLVCVCHPRRLQQQKQSMFVVNEPTEQKQSRKHKRSYHIVDSLTTSTGKRPPHTCPSEAPCGYDYGYEKSRGFYLIYKGSYCFCSPRLHRPRYQPKRDVFVLNGPIRYGFLKPQYVHKQYKLKKGREYELGSRGICPYEAPCYVDRQPNGFYLAYQGGVCYCPPR